MAKKEGRAVSIVKHRAMPLMWVGDERRRAKLFMEFGELRLYVLQRERHCTFQEVFVGVDVPQSRDLVGIRLCNANDFKDLKRVARLVATVPQTVVAFLVWQRDRYLAEPFIAWSPREREVLGIDLAEEERRIRAAKESRQKRLEEWEAKRAADNAEISRKILADEPVGGVRVMRLARDLNLPLTQQDLGVLARITAINSQQIQSRQKYAKGARAFHVYRAVRKALQAKQQKAAP